LLRRRPYLIFHGISDGGVEVCPIGFSLHDGGSLLGDLGGGSLPVDLDGAVAVVEDAGGKLGWLEKAARRWVVEDDAPDRGHAGPSRAHGLVAYLGALAELEIGSWVFPTRKILPLYSIFEGHYCYGKSREKVGE
jgi:hypothetical protein